MAMGQHQWYHFGVGAPPILVNFSGVWDVHWGYGVLTHSHIHMCLQGVSYLQPEGPKGKPGRRAGGASQQFREGFGLPDLGRRVVNPAPAAGGVRGDII